MEPARAMIVVRSVVVDSHASERLHADLGTAFQNGEASTGRTESDTMAETGKPFRLPRRGVTH